MSSLNSNNGHLIQDIIYCANCKINRVTTDIPRSKLVTLIMFSGNMRHFTISLNNVMVMGHHLPLMAMVGLLECMEWEDG